MNTKLRIAQGVMVSILAISPAYGAKMQVCLNDSGQITAKSKCKAGETGLNLAELAKRLPVNAQPIITPAPSNSTGNTSPILTADDVNALIAAQLGRPLSLADVKAEVAAQIGKPVSLADVKAEVAAQIGKPVSLADVKAEVAAQIGAPLTRAQVIGLIAAYVACHDRNLAGQLAHDAWVATLATIDAYAETVASTNPVSIRGSLDDLNAAAANFHAIVQAVQGGDYDKLADVTPKARAYLSLAISAYASSETFQSIRRSVVSDLKAIVAQGVPDFIPEACGQ